MLHTLKTYIQQRFKPAVFFPLAVYLVAYAQPDFENAGDVFKSFFIISFLLFGFRLFDDLWSREHDILKVNRDYVQPENFVLLRQFLIGYLAFLLCAVWLLKTEIAVAFVIFTALNIAAYFTLFKKRKWSFILPLLKYPFLCFLLFAFFKNGESLLTQVLIPASLLPAFLLFEVFDDEEFSFKSWVIFSIFLVGNLLLFCANQASVFAPFFAAIGVIIFALILKDKTRLKTILPYAILIYFLILRVLVQL
ncbi:MAG TPA: hypothetical protein VEC36_12715 [Patescibacteria group bacterium]|nr:hypothetical protein [Patescibacteria group bacterium]